MTRLEFIETMKALMPNENIDESKGIAYFNGIKFAYTSRYISVVGRIPYAVAMSIYQKYPNDTGIKAGSFSFGTNPQYALTDDIYEKKKNNPSLHLSVASKRLKQRDNSNKYIPQYRIDNIKGLIIVFKELEYYFNSKNNEACLDKDIAAIVAEVNSKIIEDINPGITGATWMKQTINAMAYYQSWNETNKSLDMKQLRRALDEFDRCINPFMENDLPISEVVNDLSNLDFYFSFPEYDLENDERFCKITMTDQESGSYTLFGINPGGFSYAGMFNLDEESIRVGHFYCYEEKEENQGETLLISYYNKDGSCTSTIRYNITQGTIAEGRESQKPATKMQIAIIYLKLTKCINLAANLTVNNLSRNRVQKGN